MKPADAIRAVQITSVPECARGAPVHLGDPALIGITRRLTTAMRFRGDGGRNSRVFWACGVTPQAAVSQARPAFCITHAPGKMLITDLLNHQLRTF
jgi:uncharacterized protein YcsI (UPF0317 family)